MRLIKNKSFFYVFIAFILNISVTNAQSAGYQTFDNEKDSEDRGLVEMSRSIDTTLLAEIIPAHFEISRSPPPESLIPFLKWLESDVMGNTVTTKSMKVAGFSGLGVGLIAAYASFPLAGDFAVLLSQKLGLTSTDAMYVIFGINAAIPSMALNSIATQHEFQSLVSPAGIEDQLFKKTTLLKSVDFVAHIFSVFAAMSSGYVGYMVSENFPLPLNILFTACAYGGCYTFTAESQKRISRSLVCFSNQEKRNRFKRKALHDALVLSAKQVSTLPRESVEEIYERLYTAASPYTAENSEKAHLEHSEKLRTLLSIGIRMPPLVPRSKCNVFGEKVVKSLGTFIGLAETYVAFSLVDEVTELLLGSVIGINDSSTIKAISYTVSSLACIPWASLDVEGVTGRFNRIYHGLFNKNESYQEEFVNPRVRKIISRFSAWGGVSSAIPPTYLAIKTTEGLPLGARAIISAATFLCPTAVLTEALDTMLYRGWNWIKTFKNDSLEKQKERIVMSLRSVLVKIEEFPDSIIGPLYNMLSEINMSTDHNSVDRYS